MADDDIFGRSDDDFFNSDDDFTLGDDLGEEPIFGGFDENLGLAAGDDDLLASQMFEEDEPGISRTFKMLIGAGIALVFVIVILLILFAVLSGDELTAGEKTGTAVAIINDNLATEYSSTLTAIALSDNATSTAAAHSQETATAVRIGQLTQEAQMTADAAASATAEAEAAATFAAQTATAEATAIAQAEATLVAGRLRGRAIVEGVPISGATMRLYRDQGDNVFSPSDLLGIPVEVIDDFASLPVSATPEGAAAEQPISYGELAEGTLADGETDRWIFTGSAGDVLFVNAVTSSTTMDLFLRLIEPGDTILAEDDNSAGNNNPSISNVELPVNGQYILEVSSITGSGSYTLSLNKGLSSPGADPTQESGYNVGKEAFVFFARQGPTATPDLTLDELIDIITTGTEGEFDFGALEPGVYWLVIDYDSLTPELQALIPPTAQLVFRFEVPYSGDFEITVVDLTATPILPTPLGTLTEFDQTATAFAERNTPIGTLQLTPGGLNTLTPTPELLGTIIVTVTELPDTGIFDNLSSGGHGDLEGTGGLTVLAIAAAGLVAVVFIARRLRSAS